MRRFTAAVVTFTLIFLALLAVDAYPGLRGGAGWRWPYALPDTWSPVIALALALACYVGGVMWMRRAAPPDAIALLWAFLGAVVITLAVVGVRGDPGFLLFTRTVSPVQTGASALAVRVMADDGVQWTLERWPAVMREAFDANLIHFTTSPPGQPLIHHAAASVFENAPFSRDVSLALRLYQCSDADVMRYTRGEIISAGMGMLMPIFAALAVFPLYSAARDLTGDRSAARRLAAWWPLIPAVALFAPTWNTLYPFLTILSFALLARGLRARGSGFALRVLSAGVVMSFTTFLNFAVLPILLLFGLFTLGATASQNVGEGAIRRLLNGLPRAVAAGLWFGLGLISMWIVFGVATGLTPLDLLRVTFESHHTLVQRADLPWLLLHPYDVLMFTGWPAAALFVGGVWIALRRLRSTGWLEMIDRLAISLLITVVVVDLIGLVQGENARILAYYAPFVLLSGAGLMARSAGFYLPLMGAQAATVLVMAAVLPVVPLDLNPMPQAPREDLATLGDLEWLPQEASFSSVDYAGEFQLDAARAVADIAAQVITLETRWSGQARTERPYQFEIIARAENAIDGAIVTEPHRWLPQNGNYLTTCWRAGDVIRDVTTIPLPVVSAPVIWTLELRAIDERTGDVLRVTLPDGTTTDALPFGPIHYP
jgi:hypothetical protein